MRNVLRIPNARLYLLGDVVSTLGDSALWLAMAIWMKELTGSSAWAGLVMFCYAVGNLASPLGGAIADRFRRLPLLIWSNLAGAALVLLLLLVHDRSQTWLVYVVIFGYGVIGSIIGPAQNALLPAIVPALARRRQRDPADPESGPAAGDAAAGSGAFRPVRRGRGGRGRCGHVPDLGRVSCRAAGP